MKNVFATIALLGGISLLQGCVRNQLLREETNAFATSAVTAATEGTKFYADLINSDHDLNSIYYALDERCHPPSIGGQMYLFKNPDAHHRSWCADSASESSYSISTEFSQETFVKEFAALRFLANYIAALSEVSADSEATASAAFSAAAADVNTILAVLKAEKESPLTDDRVKAVGGFLDFLQKLAVDAKSAKQIRELLATKGEQARADFEILVQALLGDAAFDTAIIKNKVAVAQVAVRFGKVADPFLRLKLLASYYEGSDVDRSVNASVEQCNERTKADGKSEEGKYCSSKAAGLMHALAVVHADLLNLAAGNLNEEQKAKEAKLIYARFMSVLRIFVSLTKYF